MNNDFPMPITSKNDLDFYENYLKEEFNLIPPPKEPSQSTLTQALKQHIGRFIKIETCVGNRLEIRTGKLLEVGDDYLYVLSSNRQKTLIDIKSAKFFTLLQNNTKNLYL